MIVVLTSAVVSLLGVWVLLPLLRSRVLDVPNARSSHQTPVPRAGGVAVMVGIAAALTVGAIRHSSAGAAWQVYLAVALLSFVGLIDDLWSLPARTRFACQVAAGILLAAEAPLHGWGWWLIGGGLVVIAVVGYVNAFNFMDGVNGISALNAALVGGWFAWLGGRRHDEVVMVLGLAVVGGALGFLPWNAPRARVFLGDSGSYGLGVSGACLAVLAWRSGASTQQVLAPGLVYLADTGWVLVKRARGGRALTVAHREHVYQRLVDAAAWTHLGAAGLALAAACACCLAALAPAVVAWSIIVLVLLGYLAAPRMVRRREGVVA